MNLEAFDVWRTVSSGAQATVTGARVMKKAYGGPNIPFPRQHAVAQDPIVAFHRETKALDALESVAATLQKRGHHSLFSVGMDPFPHIVARDETKPHIVVTDCGVPLQDAWDKAPKKASEWRAQLLCILERLSAANVYHNDIHPGNVLVGHDGQLKLIDFAWATFDTPNFPEMNITTEDVLEAETLHGVFRRVFERAQLFFGDTMPKRVQVIENMTKRMMPLSEKTTDDDIPQKYRNASTIVQSNVVQT